MGEQKTNTWMSDDQIIKLKTFLAQQLTCIMMWAICMTVALVVIIAIDIWQGYVISELRTQLKIQNMASGELGDALSRLGDDIADIRASGRGEQHRNATVMATPVQTELGKLVSEQRGSRRLFLASLCEQYDRWGQLANISKPIPDELKARLFATLLEPETFRNDHFPLIAALMLMEHRKDFPYRIFHPKYFPYPVREIFTGTDTKSVQTQRKMYEKLMAEHPGNDGTALLVKALDPKVDGKFPLNFGQNIPDMIATAITAAGGAI